MTATTIVQEAATASYGLLCFQGRGYATPYLRAVAVYFPPWHHAHYPGDYHSVSANVVTDAKEIQTHRPVEDHVNLSEVDSEWASQAALREGGRSFVVHANFVCSGEDGENLTRANAVVTGALPVRDIAVRDSHHQRHILLCGHVQGMPEVGEVCRNYLVESKNAV